MITRIVLLLLVSATPALASGYYGTEVDSFPSAFVAQVPNVPSGILVALALGIGAAFRRR